MKRLLILSGKGGTGKTTTAAAFIQFSGAKAMADCDVDAPNLHLVSAMTGEPQRTAFFGGDKASIDPDSCVGCGDCARHCRFDAIQRQGSICQVDEYACEGCGVCVRVCPQDAISLLPDEAGQQTLYQQERIFSTATLKMGRGNSGKLVSEVKKAMNSAVERTGDVPLAVIDGSPGIGCPVIASVNGVDLVLVVAEPSLSGRSDLERIVKTAASLRAPVAVCVNKWDASPQQTQAIETYCQQNQLSFVGRVPYDPQAAQAINAGRSLAEYDCPAREALIQVYQKTMKLLEDQP